MQQGVLASFRHFFRDGMVLTGAMDSTLLEWKATAEQMQGAFEQDDINLEVDEFLNFPRALTGTQVFGLPLACTLLFQYRNPLLLLLLPRSKSWLADHAFVLL